MWDLTHSETPGKVMMYNKQTKKYHVIHAGRVGKAIHLLNEDSALECFHSEYSRCKCQKKCYNNVITKETILNERRTIAGLTDEDAVGDYLISVIRRDGGLKINGKVVCRPFYSKLCGVGENKIAKASRLAKLGCNQDVKWGHDPTRGNQHGGKQLKGDHAYAFWYVWFDKNCSQPNDDIRLFPADYSYDDIWRECFEPWWKDQGQPASEKPKQSYWERVRKHPDFKDVKRRAKHFHCRCTTCSVLRKQCSAAFTSTLGLEQWTSVHINTHTHSIIIFNTNNDKHNGQTPLRFYCALIAGKEKARGSYSQLEAFGSSAGRRIRPMPVGNGATEP